MNRFVHALRHDALDRLPEILRIALGAGGLVLVLTGVRWIGGVVAQDIWSQAYIPIMIIAGAIFTVDSFRELQNDGHRIAFLLRPASLVDKVGSKLIVSSLGAWLFITTAFLLVSLVAGLLYLLLGGDAAQFGVFFANGRWLAIALETFVDFLPLHAIALFGAVYFRKNPAAKTFVASLAWVISWALTSVLAARLVFARYLSFDGGEVDFVAPGRRGFPELGSGMGDEMVRQILPFYLRNPEWIEPVMTIAIVAVFWSLTVLRLRETEA